VGTTTPPPSDVWPLQELRAVAPAWHTVVLVVAFLGVSYLSAGTQADVVTKHGRVPIYVTTMVWEWLLLLYAWWGMRQRKVSLGQITGGRWNTVEDVLLDIAIGVGFWLLIALLLAAIGYALGLGGAKQMQQAKENILVLLPEGPLEVLLWIGLSITAGFCEELLFRGYLMAQFAAATRNVALGLLLQALVFGGSHAYEGWQRMILISIEGVALGLLVILRKNLRSAMIAHGMQDAVAGLLGRLATKAIK